MRARPSIAMKIFSKLNLISKKEQKLLDQWIIEKTYNHANKLTGKIIAEIK